MRRRAIRPDRWHTYGAPILKLTALQLQLLRQLIPYNQRSVCEKILARSQLQFQRMAAPRYKPQGGQRTKIDAATT